MNLLKNSSKLATFLVKPLIPRSVKGKNFHACVINPKQKRTQYDGYPAEVPSGGYKPYKYAFFIVAVPAIIALSFWNYTQHEHHKKCYQRPPFVKYTYLYKRTHPYFWGDGNHTLFHNKLKNALPEGYEDLDDDK